MIILRRYFVNLKYMYSVEDATDYTDHLTIWCSTCLLTLALCCYWENVSVPLFYCFIGHDCPKSLCASSCNRLVAVMRWKCAWVVGFHFDHTGGDHGVGSFRNQVPCYENNLFWFMVCCLPASKRPWGKRLVAGSLQAEWII